MLYRALAPISRELHNPSKVSVSKFNFIHPFGNVMPTR